MCSFIRPEAFLFNWSTTNKIFFFGEKKGSASYHFRDPKISYELHQTDLLVSAASSHTSKMIISSFLVKLSKNFLPWNPLQKICPQCLNSMFAEVPVAIFCKPCKADTEWRKPKPQTCQNCIVTTCWQRNAHKRRWYLFSFCITAYFWCYHENISFISYQKCKFRQGMTSVDQIACWCDFNTSHHQQVITRFSSKECCWGDLW